MQLQFIIILYFFNFLNPLLLGNSNQLCLMQLFYISIQIKHILIFKLLILFLTALFIFKLMQNRVQSKSRLQQYASTREYDSTTPQIKKNLKDATKSNKKAKPSKQLIHSQSKSKLVSKPIRNNQNINSANIPNSDNHKHKPTHIDCQHPKKDVKIQQRIKRVSSERLIKQKSTGKIGMKTQRRQVSPSPISIRQYTHEEKGKTTRNGTNRSEKEKKVGSKHKEEQVGLKRNGSKAYLIGKGDTFDRNNRNRNSIKTQMSSKTQSVIKQDDRKKGGLKKPKKVIKKQQKSVVAKPYIAQKGEKSKIQQMVKRSILYSQVSFQQYNPDHPCESAFVSNDKYFLPYPDLKAVKTEGCQAENRSIMSYSRLEIAQNRAAIKIQKVFRGYITRKYIQEAKYIISKVKCIQAWWRKILSAKSDRQNQKHISASNSLITLKDFNDTLKTDRQKAFSQSKQNCLSNNKTNIKQLIINILEQNEQSDQQHDKDMSSVSRDKSLSKQVYIQLKLQDEINSQRKFNIISPKNMMSPSSVRTPTNSLFSFKESMTISAEKQKIKDILSSPRMKSPQQLKNTPKSSCRQQALFKKAEVQQKLRPFETNYAVLQSFSMSIVDYFRERPAQIKPFVDRLLRLCQFRTLLVLKNWSQHTLCYDEMMEIDDSPSADFEFLQIFQKPAVLDQQLRQNILSFPQIQIDLQGQSFDLKSSVNKQIHRMYLEFMFDVLQEAFYEQYKGSVMIYGQSLSKRYYESQDAVLSHFFSQGLGYLCRWGSIRCGIFEQLPISQEQIVKQQRFRQLQRQMDHWDMGLGSAFAIKVQTSQWLVFALICQMAEQYGRFRLQY